MPSVPCRHSIKEGEEQEDLPACLAWAHRFEFADTLYDRVQPPGQHSQLGFVPTAVRLTHKIIAIARRREQASIRRKRTSSRFT